MPVLRNGNTNGLATKRRKLSHDSEGANNVSSDVSDSAEALKDADDGLESPVADAEGGDDDDRTVNSTTQAHKSGTLRRPNAAAPLSMLSTPSTLPMMVQNLVFDSRTDHSAKFRKLQSTTDRIIKTIKAISEETPKSLAEAQSHARKSLRVAIPWTFVPAEDVKYKFTYAKPTAITIGGPLAQGIALREYSTLTLIPEMPSEMFQEKDYLNNRALHKRAFYLACIASAIKKELGEEFSIQYVYESDNELVPMLRLSVKESKALHRGSIFEVSPALPSSLWSIQKLLPNRNCLRKNGIHDGDSRHETSATAHYNSTICRLCSANAMHQLIENAAQKADSFRDACLLGGVWLQQRGLASPQEEGGFGVQEWALMCALLLESGGHQGRPLFSLRYSSLQLLKAMLQVLSSRDMYDPFVVRGSFPLSIAHEPVLLDAVTGVNVLDKMTAWSYKRMKQYATVSLTALNSKKSNGFEATFLSKVSTPILAYDETYEIDATWPSKKQGTKSFPARLYSALKTGFGDRTSLIDIRTGSSSAWNIDSPTPSRKPTKTTIGIVVNAETTSRLVDHGPAVEEKEESKNFRDFWGEKAELRRFKDGQISESLVWSANTSVTKQIVHLICTNHLGVPSSSVKSSTSLPELRLASSISAEEAFSAVNSKFQALSSTLHHLDGLPLPIRSVTPASELLCSASVLHPFEPCTAQPIDVLIQFDTSGRWPDNLQAIQYTKIAFLTKIGDLLTQHDRTFETCVGLEHASTSSAGTHNSSYLDIVQSSPSPQLPPTVFRLRIHHDRELHLIQQSLALKSLSQPQRETYQAALLELRLASIAVPIHTMEVRNLITQYPPLSATIRLLKSWVSAHHLSAHIPVQILDIIACQIFLSPAPWPIPGTSTVAFARCLAFLARWDWSAEPLIVDLSSSQDMTTEQRRELEMRFQAWRKMDPIMNQVAWFVGTNVDSTGVVWTQSPGTGDPSARPMRVVAGRVTALASAALTLLKAKAETESSIVTKNDWEEVFTSTLTDFDFVIHLKPSVVGRKGTKKSVNGRFKNLEIASTLDVDTTGIDTVDCYMRELSQSFGSVAMFFYAGKHSGSSVIGGLWRPRVRDKEARPWKIRLGASTVPNDMVGTDERTEKHLCQINFDAMLAEMGMLGDGMIEKIIVQGT